MVQGYRDIAEHLCADIDPAALKINERVPPEIVVMVVPVDYPALKSFRGIRRIVNETELQAPMFEDSQRL